MAVVTQSKNQFTVKGYPGDNKTLLAFNFADKSLATNLAGFTIQCQIPGGQPFYLFNFLQFETPGPPVPGTDPHLTVNAPIQKFRWVDFAHAGAKGGPIVTGDYIYTVTPRYFDGKGTMLAMDATKSVAVTVPVGPFVSGKLKLGFTRGYMQSQAYVRDFGQKTPVQPSGRGLQYTTSAQAGTNAAGASVTFEQIYEFMGATAREQVFDVLKEVVNDPTLHLDVFAYDLNEPDVVAGFLQLAKEGRIRIILDSASLHMPTTVKGKTTSPLEAAFQTAYQAAAKDATTLKRGCFARYSHDKVLIVSKIAAAGNVPQRVLTGSTNFSVTGLYVNANHVLVFDDPAVATYYTQVFDESWTVLTTEKVSTAEAAAFAATTLATTAFTPTVQGVGSLSINVSPHTTADAAKVLGAIADRVKAEGSATNGSVLFAVMEMAKSVSPVCDALGAVHATQTVFSYGISDDPEGIALYAPGSKTGVLVTGKPSLGLLPPPFDAVPVIMGHEIHDKFVVCGINGPDPVVWCGSSNLATGGEQQNGDNLLEIHDADVAMAFAIEALLLVDHYNFLDRYAKPPSATAPKAAKGGTTPKGGTKAKGGTGTAVKKASATKTPAKAVPKKTAKKAAVKTPAKTTASVTATKKVAAKKGVPKAPAKKAAATKVAVKKAPAKKVAAKKTAAKKSEKKGVR
jgi:hypothetical protein